MGGVKCEYGVDNVVWSIRDDRRVPGHPLSKSPEVTKMLNTVITTREVTENLPLPDASKAADPDRIRLALMAGILREALAGLFDASLDEGELTGD